MKMTLKDLGIGKKAVIKSTGGTGAVRQHLLDMGMISGVEVMMTKHAPMGDPLEVRIFGYELTLRKDEASKIEIEELDSTNTEASENIPDTESLQNPIVFHPGLGEEGKFHQKETEKPLPEGTLLTYALVGNQNCGKTTLFN